MITQGTVPSGASNRSVWRESGLTTAAIDLESFWLAPFDRPLLHTPYAQSVRTSERAGKEQDGLIDPIVPRKIRARQGPDSDPFLVVGRWLGWVTEVLEDTFLGVVQDLVGDAPPHTVELPKQIVSPFDYPLLKTDQTFYWTVGFRRRRGGVQVQEALVRFRRAPISEPWLERLGSVWAADIREALYEDDGY